MDTMSEPTPPPATDTPPPPESAPPRQAHKVSPEHAAALRATRPSKDRTHLLMVGVPLFLFVMLAVFMFKFNETSRPVRTEYKTEKPHMLPMTKLCHAHAVKELPGDRWELVYDFEAVARPAEGEAKEQIMKRVAGQLRDWKGPRNSPEQIREQRRPEHESISVRTDLLPRTHLLSQLSFQDGMEIEAEFDPGKAGQVWIFFYYFYDYESTGTALLLSQEKGTAQFVRYRRDLLFDDPRGKPGAFKLEPGQRAKVRIVTENHPQHAGYSARAYMGEQLLTSADFPPEWTPDRRYDRGESKRMLVADNFVPPRAGFVALASQPLGATTIFKAALRGTVAESWRTERTKRIEILEQHEKEAQLLLEQERSAEPSPTPAPVPAP